MHTFLMFGNVMRTNTSVHIYNGTIVFLCKSRVVDSIAETAMKGVTNLVSETFILAHDVCSLYGIPLMFSCTKAKNISRPWYQ